jgi:hypothetical protein
MEIACKNKITLLQVSVTSSGRNGQMSVLLFSTCFPKITMSCEEDKNYALNNIKHSFVSLNVFNMFIR